MTVLAAQVLLIFAGLTAVAEGKSALLIVDVQECFLPGGSLGVGGADRIIPVLNSLRQEKDCLFDLVIKSQDYHPHQHISFGASNGLPNIDVGYPIPMKCIEPDSGRLADAACCPDVDAMEEHLRSNVTMARSTMTDNAACNTCFTNSSACFSMEQAMWPIHCLQDGDSVLSDQLMSKDTDVLVQKGTNKNVDAYSAFMDNTKNLKTALHGILQDHGITDLYIAGIATDFCVKWTAEDAVHLGFNTFVVEDGAAGIGIPLGGNETTITAGIAAMKAEGVEFVQASDLQKKMCPAAPDGGKCNTIPGDKVAKLKMHGWIAKGCSK